MPPNSGDVSDAEFSSSIVPYVTLGDLTFVLSSDRKNIVSDSRPSLLNTVFCSMSVCTLGETLRLFLVKTFRLGDRMGVGVLGRFGLMWMRLSVVLALRIL